MARPNFIRYGERNHRAKYPDSVVARARLIASRGYGARDVQLSLKDEGHVIPYFTICYWLRGERA